MKKPISIINHDVLRNLLLLIKQISDEQNQYENILGVRIPLVDTIGDRIEDIILDYLGVPPDTTLCYLGDGDISRYYDPENSECQNCTGCFCRDFVYEYIFAYENEEISLDEVMQKLLDWNKEG